MYCPQCRAANEDAAKFCCQCGLNIDEYRQKWRASGTGTGPGGNQTYASPGNQQQPQYQQAPCPPPYTSAPYQQSYITAPNVASHLVWAILCFFFTFWPTAIPAIVYAAQVGEKVNRGDYAGAVNSSNAAKRWCWISFWIAVAFWVLAIILIVVLIVIGISVSGSGSSGYTY